MKTFSSILYHHHGVLLLSISVFRYRLSLLLLMPDALNCTVGEIMWWFKPTEQIRLMALLGCIRNMVLSGLKLWNHNWFWLEFLQRKKSRVNLYFIKNGWKWRCSLHAQFKYCACVRAPIWVNLSVDVIRLLWILLGLTKTGSITHSHWQTETHACDQTDTLMHVSSQTPDIHKSDLTLVNAHMHAWSDLLGV